jgi:hypothetical protein
MQREEMELGKDYYVLGMTTKGHFLWQRTVAFPLIYGDDDERIPQGARALLVFAEHQRAADGLTDQEVGRWGAEHVQQAVQSGDDMLRGRVLLVPIGPPEPRSVVRNDCGLASEPGREVSPSLDGASLEDHYGQAALDVLPPGGIYVDGVAVEIDHARARLRRAVTIDEPIEKGPDVRLDHIRRIPVPVSDRPALHRYGAERATESTMEGLLHGALAVAEIILRHCTISLGVC